MHVASELRDAGREGDKLHGEIKSRTWVMAMSAVCLERTRRLVKMMSKSTSLTAFPPASASITPFSVNGISTSLYIHHKDFASQPRPNHISRTPRMQAFHHQPNSSTFILEREKRSKSAEFSLSVENEQGHAFMHLIFSMWLLHGHSFGCYLHDASPSPEVKSLS